MALSLLKKEKGKLFGSVDEKKGNVPGAALKLSKKKFSSSHNTPSYRPQILKASSSTPHYPLPNHLIREFPALI